MKLNELANSEKKKICTNEKVFTGNKKCIIGSSNEINGNDNTVYGSENEIKGDRNIIFGAKNKITGNKNIFLGFDNIVISGKGNKEIYKRETGVKRKRNRCQDVKDLLNIKEPPKKKRKIE
jgi:hypothetical protein